VKETTSSFEKLSKMDEYLEEPLKEMVLMKYSVSSINKEKNIKKN